MQILGVILFVIAVTILLSFVGKFAKPVRRKRRDSLRQIYEDQYWSEKENAVPEIVSAGDDDYDDDD
ncbi:MAG: hypothetical protein LR001_07250 [Clostridiales bacterium]|nr:hypothetical protein [Clostridiales bacterium]